MIRKDDGLFQESSSQVNRRRIFINIYLMGHKR